jgi:hypothetical protein
MTMQNLGIIFLIRAQGILAFERDYCTRTLDNSGLTIGSLAMVKQFNVEIFYCKIIGWLAMVLILKNGFYL